MEMRDIKTRKMFICPGPKTPECSRRESTYQWPTGWMQATANRQKYLDWSPKRRARPERSEGQQREAVPHQARRAGAIGEI